ncbi:MAG: acylphosphatase [Candidatus Micrarchaeaceae archaeon]
MRIFLIVHGFVQGVGYRALVKREADRYGVNGMVMNAKDGSVHILAEADEHVLELFKDAIEVDIPKGPQVKHIEAFYEGSSGFPKDAKSYSGKFVIERE